MPVTNEEGEVTQVANVTTFRPKRVKSDIYKDAIMTPDIMESNMSKHVDAYKYKYKTHDKKYDTHSRYDDKYDKYHDKYHNNKYHDNNRYHKYDGHSNDNYNHKYDSYEKYGKRDNYVKKKKNEYTKYDEHCKKSYLKKNQCQAIFASATASHQVFILRSIGGDEAVQISTYAPTGFTNANIFSNRARGGCVNDYDIELRLQNATDPGQSVARLTYVIKEVGLLYEYQVTIISSPYPLYPFVTDLNIKREKVSVDAYNVFEPTVAGDFAQHDIIPSTGIIMSDFLTTNECFDLMVFPKQEERWLCINTGAGVTFLRDASTRTDYIPPDSNNPNLGVQIFNPWYTSTTICGQNYIAGVGHTPNYEFVRAKASLKYPYFDDIEVFYSMTTVIQPIYLYSPPNTNILYACVGYNVYRFDEAYTAPITVEPTVNTFAFGNVCTRIISFTSCPNQVYVTTLAGEIWYSNDGAETFTEITTGAITIEPGLIDMVAFDVPQHSENYVRT